MITIHIDAWAVGGFLLGWFVLGPFLSGIARAAGDDLVAAYRLWRARRALRRFGRSLREAAVPREQP